jgi:hypothetical protein
VMRLTGIDQGTPDQKESIAENKITSFTPSELLHAHAIGHLRDPDSYSPEEYLAALERARLEHHDLFVESNPSAAQAEREQLRRRQNAQASS